MLRAGKFIIPAGRNSSVMKGAQSFDTYGKPFSKKVYYKLRSKYQVS